MDRRVVRWGIAGALLGSLAIATSAGAKPRLGFIKSSRSAQSAEAGNRDESIRWVHDLRVAHHVSVATGRPILIVFGASWCGPCKKLQNEVLSQPRLATYINKMFVPVHIDIDQNRKVAETLEVKEVPTSVVLSSNGDLLAKFVGCVEAPQYAQALKESLAYQKTLASAEK